MSIRQMTSVIDELYEAHKTLLALSQEKTNYIKDGELDQLTKLLMKEQKQTRVIDKLEEKRSNLLNELKDQGVLSENIATITEILQNLHDEEEADQLEKTATKLTQVIVDIREQEQLNQMLLEQSMQFVQLSLNMLNPTIENMNYNHKQEQSTADRSIFDSKA